MSALPSLEGPSSDPTAESQTRPKSESPINTRKATAAISSGRPKFDAWDWEPKISTPFQSHQVSINTRFGQRTIRALFPRLQLAAFGLQVTLPILTRDDSDQINAGEASFQQAYLAVTSAQRDLIQRYESILDSNAVKRSLNYNETRQYTIKAYSPNANRALGIFSALDRIVALADELWYASLFSTSQTKAAQMEAVSQVKNFVNAMDGLWKRSKSAIQRVGTPEAVQKVTEAMGSAFSADLSVPDGEDDSGLTLDAHGDETAPSETANEGVATAQDVSSAERRTRKRPGEQAAA